MVHKRFLNIPVILIAFAGICSFIVNDDLPTRIKQQLDKWVYEQPIAYFNAGKGTYRVVIEGIDNSGNLGRQVYQYTVE